VPVNHVKGFAKRRGGEGFGRHSTLQKETVRGRTLVDKPSGDPREEKGNASEDRPKERPEAFHETRREKEIEVNFLKET